MLEYMEVMLKLCPEAEVDSALASTAFCDFTQCGMAIMKQPRAVQPKTKYTCKMDQDLNLG